MTVNRLNIDSAHAVSNRWAIHEQTIDDIFRNVWKTLSIHNSLNLKHLWISLSHWCKFNWRFISQKTLPASKHLSTSAWISHKQSVWMVALHWETEFIACWIIPCSKWKPHYGITSLWQKALFHSHKACMMDEWGWMFKIIILMLTVSSSQRTLAMLSIPVDFSIRTSVFISMSLQKSAIVTLHNYTIWPLKIVLFV